MHVLHTCEAKDGGVRQNQLFTIIQILQDETTKPTMAELDFRFRQVTILKEDVIGQGAYGVVYKAKCDELICAAKYLHPTFFISHDPGSRHIARRFRKECDLLSRLKHPNIVQYLGTHEEDGLNTVILLMELLDSNLHSYLAHKCNPLPFHLELNICHDVSRAIDYLHANNIHHRDLSAKNILLLGELRAKVSDFGMSKLRDTNQGLTSITACPGSMHYMPPEVLKVPPDLTDTLDEFSLGVVIIQILTRIEPHPTALHQGTGSILKVVPEIQRRQNDIDLCDPANPLLQIAISCISNNPLERPTAEKICQLLTLLKNTSQYKNSERGILDVHVSDAKAGADLNESGDAKSFDFVVVEMNDADGLYSVKIKELTNLLNDKDKLLDEKERLLSLRTSQVFEKQKTIDEFQMKVEEKEAEMSVKVVEIVDMSSELEVMKNTLSLKESEIIMKEQQLQEKEEQLRRKESAIATKNEKQANFDEEYSKCLQKIETLQQEILSKDHIIREFQDSLPLDASKLDSSSVSSSNGIIPPESRPKRPKSLNLKWLTVSQTPLLFEPQSSMIVSCKDKVFISFCNYCRNEGRIYEYNVKTDTWLLLPVVKKGEFSLVVIDDSYVAAVGGCYNLKDTGSILRLLPDSPSPFKWVKAFADVPTSRSFPLCAALGNYLLVAGGEKNGRPVAAVEVLDMRSETWHYVRTLPSSLSLFTRMRVATANRFAYFTGGFEDGILSNAAYAVNIDRLVNETRNAEEQLWLELPDLPVSGASIVSIRKRLLALGGYNVITKLSSDLIYEFDQINGLWEKVGSLPSSITRGLTSIVTVNAKTILVNIGGNTSSGVSSKTNLAYL
jgi:serine/threonine protein kinase